MKDKRRHPDAWTAVTVHRSDHDHLAHHHYVTHPKWSPDSHLHDGSQSAAKRGWFVFKHEPSLASVSTEQRPLIRSETTTTTGSTDQPLIQASLPFTEKYGRCLDILHYGANSTVRLHLNKLPGSDLKSKQLLAIKVYRCNILDSSNPLSRSSHGSPESIANFHPHHPNILAILDLLYNERSELCLVMPICAGGNLHELISHTGGPISTNEADCIIAQILGALSFLHEQNTAHRDIRLETVLLTENGSVKLAGFGDGHIRRIWSECAVPTEETFRPRSQSHPASASAAAWSFSLPWLFSSSKTNPSARASGEMAHSTVSYPGMSLPYIPPEGFHSRSRAVLGHGDLPHRDGDDDDPRPADIWATAIIYVALITGRLIWRSARPHHEDPVYLDYLYGRCSEDGYPPIEALGKRRGNAIYAMLHPTARKRITSSQLLQSEWMSRVSICEAGLLGR
ncbi:hypothetical protein N7466_011471 [Penicillium verhagenii]|uniref:uncharacterized protein n=1 Tax=Penicillium verhagenii TaxID=1562060 RepID=UPI0025457BB7|nr:uncharacterized protein N7466_011471 [Penicillium verhagenii]KAJ5915538.1 hypothetical protein N7466_011471 [Penicillium verhagenii]